MGENKREKNKELNIYYLTSSAPIKKDTRVTESAAKTKVRSKRPSFEKRDTVTPTIKVTKFFVLDTVTENVENQICDSLSVVQLVFFKSLRNNLDLIHEHTIFFENLSGKPSTFSPFPLGRRYPR